MKPLAALSAAVALGAAIPIPGSAQRQTDFRWAGSIPRGDVIEIRNVSGNVRAGHTSGAAVEVVAVKHGRRAHFEDVDFEVVEGRSGVTICTIYRNRRGRWSACDGRGDHDMDWDDFDVEVDYEVRVPGGVRFLGATVSGDIEAEGLDAEVTARSVSGDIFVSTTHLAKASTVSGSIDARLGRADWRGSLQFSTVSGDIVLRLPERVDAEVEFATVTGEIDSDYRITMRGRRFRMGNVRGTIGDGGGRSLVLKTVSGDVILRRGD